METPRFTNAGQFTPEGQQVIDYIEERVIKALEGGADALNNEIGPVKDYYLQVHSGTGHMSAVQWAENRATYGMGQVWGYMQSLQEKQTQTEAVNEVDAKLAKVMERLDMLESSNEALKKENASLKGQNTKLKNKLAEATEEAEDASEDSGEDVVDDVANDADETTGDETPDGTTEDVDTPEAD